MQYLINYSLVTMVTSAGAPERDQLISMGARRHSRQGGTCPHPLKMLQSVLCISSYSKRSVDQLLMHHFHKGEGAEYRAPKARQSRRRRRRVGCGMEREYHPPQRTRESGGAS